MEITNEKTVGKKNFGLKAKILIIMIITIICTSTILSGLAYMNSSKVIRENSLENIEQKIELVNEKINALTNNTEAVTTAIISTGLLKQDMTEEDLVAFNAYFENIASAYPEIINFVYLSPEKYYLYPYMDLSAHKPSDSAVYIEIKDSGEEKVWRQPYVDDATGELVVSYYQRLTIDGEFAGFMELDVSLGHIQELVNSIKIGETGYVMLADYAGVVAVHNDAELINQEVAESELNEFAKTADSGNLVYKDSEGAKFAVIKKLDTGIQLKAIGILSNKELMEDAYMLLIVISITTIIIIALTIIIIGMLIGRITRHIEEFVETLSQMGKGDLCIRSAIERNDEIGQMANIFNNMVSNLSGLISGTKNQCGEMIKNFDELTEISSQSIGASKEITDSIEHVAESAYEQARETETIVNNFDELSQSMMDISTSLTTVNGLFDETKLINADGIKVVNNLLETTDMTNKTTEAVRAKINDISISSSEINSIVETITSIAEQTNLLSLNASIEAARAGEMGKGFAVVADEVRKLAEESSNSAKEIKDIISKIQEQTSAAVSEVQEAKRSMDVQTEAVQDTRESFEKLNSSIDNVAGNIKDIETLNQNMMDVKTHIEKIVNNLSAKATENIEATEDMSAITEEQLAIINNIIEMMNGLAQNAASLNEEIAVFKTEE